MIKVSDLTDNERVERELVMFKVTAEQASSRAEIMQIASIFRAHIVDVGAKSVILQVIGDTDKINALEKLLRQFGIKELIRTGRSRSSRHEDSDEQQIIFLLPHGTVSGEILHNPYHRFSSTSRYEAHAPAHEDRFCVCTPLA